MNIWLRALTLYMDDQEFKSSVYHMHRLWSWLLCCLPSLVSQEISSYTITSVSQYNKKLYHDEKQDSNALVQVTLALAHCVWAPQWALGAPTVSIYVFQLRVQALASTELGVQAPQVKGGHSENHTWYVSLANWGMTLTKTPAKNSDHKQEWY